MDKPARILVVDDDEGIRNTMKAILEDEGYIVDSAATGSEAVQKTDETVYNVALIDIRLPDMEGVELLTRMKDVVPKIRKIMVTGYPSIQNAITALNNNADAYIVKPVDIQKMLGTIREQLCIQKNQKKYSEQKVAEFIETRAKELSETQLSGI
ncbi:MAG: response regulator [Candidatus Bathyarchaeia archaeon]